MTATDDRVQRLQELAASGIMSRSQERAYHRAWARGEIHSDLEPDRGPLPWRIRFNRRFMWFTYGRDEMINFIRAFWPIMIIGAVTFFAGFIAGRL